MHHGEHMSWVVYIVKAVIRVLDNVREKLNLLTAIVETFKEILTDLHEYADAGESVTNQSGRGTRNQSLRN